MMSNSSSIQRCTYLDLLRIMASFLVCYNHTYAYHLFLDQTADGSILSWINVFLSVLTGINVPLFFMVSGALLLGRQESYSTILYKRVWRMVVLIVSSSFVTYFLVPPGNLSVRDFIQRFFSGTVNGSHWYLFSYIGFLLMLPFLRSIAQHLTGQGLLYLAILRTIFIPGRMILNFWLNHWGFDPVILSEHLQLPLVVLDCLYFPLAGYYCGNTLQPNQLTNRHIWICTGILLGGTLLSSFMTYAEGFYTGFSQDYLRMFTHTSAPAIFVLVRWWLEQITLPHKLETLLGKISSVTIGIYLLEPIVVRWLYLPFFRHIPWNSVTITFFSILWCFLCMCVGGILTWLLRLIPGVKKYL